MERMTDKSLTKACNDPWDYCGLDHVCKRDCHKPEPCRIPKMVHRLAEIEDVLGDTYDLGRLRELVQADREGRCVVFKFGIGSTVYRAWIRPDGSCPYISADIVRTVKDMLNAEEWDNAYHTYQEAEKALKECGKGVDNQNSG